MGFAPKVPTNAGWAPPQSFQNASLQVPKARRSHNVGLHKEMGRTREGS